MPRQFYTEKDIQDLFNSGVKSLQVTDDVVLTDLAYEKARRLGLQIITDRPENPPAAPVRPYLSEGQPAQARPERRPVSRDVSQPALNPALREASQWSPRSEKENTSPIEQRIRAAVIARLGNQVDAKLLDGIIDRVLKSTGLR